MNAARLPAAVDTFEDDLVNCTEALRRLQTLARLFVRPQPPAKSVIALRVVLVPGTANPWRLVENWQSFDRHRKRMLCFRSVEQVGQSLEEYGAWQRADELFVANHMSTPGGFPGVTADWVPSKDFDIVFAKQRDAMRAQICRTLPEEVVILS
jgi:hypothetical protein